MSLGSFTFTVGRRGAVFRALASWVLPESRLASPAQGPDRGRGCSEVGTREVQLRNLGSFSENVPLPQSSSSGGRQHLLGSPWEMMAGTNLATRWMFVYISMYYALGHEDGTYSEVSAKLRII